MQENRDVLETITERSVFLEALELDEVSRPGFVKSRCGSDDKLSERVIRLLSSTRPADASLSDSSGASVFEMASEAWGERLPSETEALNDTVVSEQFEFFESQIGPYRLIRKLGEGGSSIVYLAEQVSPIQRLIALKVIKPGMESGANLARFKQEQRALEALSHRHIAKLLDAGVSPLGRCFLALEYVDGVSITEYCQTHGLSVEQRLFVFLNVCEAVQYAHQRGIIHRDLKPNNLLISSESNLPIAKVIDFGIAKLLEVRGAASMARTQVGQLMGTLEYMSPEQASLGRSDVDVRTDVYALSGILYELLTGTPPLAPMLAECVSVPSALSVVREQIPTRPLRCIPEVGTKKESRSLRWGEGLDCIVMKGLEKSTSDRYATVQELTDDIRRYVRGDVVLARNSTAFIVLRRLVVRHRASLSVVSAIFASLLIALSVLVWGWSVTSAANKKAQEMTERSQAMKARADNICSFFLDGVEKFKPKLESSSELQELQDISVDRLLESYLDEIEKDLASEIPAIEPEVAIELLLRLGRVSYSRCDASLAIKSHEMLLPLLEKHESNNKQRILDAKRWLAGCYYVSGKHDRCEALLKEFYPFEPTCVEEAETVILLARLRLAADDINGADQIAKSIPAAFQSLDIDVVRGQIQQRLGRVRRRDCGLQSRLIEYAR